MPLRAEGEFALVKEIVETALDKSGQPVNTGTMAHDHDVYMALADAAMETRDEAALRTYAPLLMELAERDGHGLYLAIAQRADGVARRLAGDTAGAEAQLHLALEVFERLGARWQVGRTLFELGEAAVKAENGEAARTYWGRALAAFEAIQARPNAERTQEALAALG